MKKKQKVDLTVALLLTIYSIVVLLLPLVRVYNIKLVVIMTFTFYAVVNFIRFLVLRNTKDYEGLHYTLTSLGMLLVFL
jgi:hypothetical protein